MDKATGMIVVGPMRFWVPEGLSLPELGGGTKIMTTCEERDGKYWITACRPAGECDAAESAHGLLMSRHRGDRLERERVRPSEPAEQDGR